MARPPREQYPGAAFHVWSRGNRRSTVFLDDLDRARFLDDLVEEAARAGAFLLAYCLMTNHFHFAIQIDEVPLSRILHHLLTRHACRLNRSLGTQGHVFERRFGSRVLRTDGDILWTIRYIHRNPVEAGMVEAAGEWPWSSHSAYLEPDPGECLRRGVQDVRSLLGATLRRAIEAYRTLMGDDGESTSSPPAYPPRPPRLPARPGPRGPAPEPPDDDRLVVIAERVALAAGLDPLALRGPGRGRVFVEARRSLIRTATIELGMTYSSVARFLARNPSTICKHARA